jgi:thymidylate kinase
MITIPSSSVEVRPRSGPDAPVPASATEVARPEFTVLLGPDYAGKSSVMAALSAMDRTCVSYDDELVRPECSLVSDLRDGFVKRALAGMGAHYSPDFVLTLLQASVVYLRDQTLRAAPDRPVVVDSYYYKILAKCLLAGLVNHSMFAWWRSFPQPCRVVYLDVDPDEAWRRSGEGARLNRFEYHGARPTRDGFCRFQRELRQLMVEEVGAVPLTVLAGPDGVEAAAGAVHELTRRGHGSDHESGLGG